jgi:hypothetical protein
MPVLTQDFNSLDTNGDNTNMVAKWQEVVSDKEKP